MTVSGICARAVHGIEQTMRNAECPADRVRLLAARRLITAGIGAVALALSAALSQMIFHRTAPWVGAASSQASR
jgi:hypothetical protein